MATLPLSLGAGPRCSEGRLVPSCAKPCVAHRDAALRAGAARSLLYDPAAAPLASGSVLHTIAGRSPPLRARRRCCRAIGLRLHRDRCLGRRARCAPCVRNARAVLDDDGIRSGMLSRPCALPPVTLAARHRRSTLSGNVQDTLGNGVTVRGRRETEGVGASARPLKASLTAGWALTVSTPSESPLSTPCGALVFTPDAPPVQGEPVARLSPYTSMISAMDWPMVSAAASISRSPRWA